MYNPFEYFQASKVHVHVVSKNIPQFHAQNINIYIDRFLINTSH